MLQRNIHSKFTMNVSWMSNVVIVQKHSLEIPVIDGQSTDCDNCWFCRFCITNSTYFMQTPFTHLQNFYLQRI